MVRTQLRRGGGQGPVRTPVPGAKSAGELGGFGRHLSSGGGSARDLPPATVLQLQRTAGNAAVAQLVGGPPVVQRAEDDGNPVIGLKKGDGLNFGTSNLKPRVSILQSKLNEKMTAGLNPDGMFGPRTGRALEDFEESIGEERVQSVNKVTGDSLMDKTSPPKPTPPESILNPVLERVLDEALFRYINILLGQRDGLTELERDLATLEKPKTLKTQAIDLLKSLGEKGFDFLLAGAGGVFITPIKAALKDLGTEFLGDGLDKAFDKAKDAAKTEVKTQVDQLTAGSPPNLTTFLDSQRNAVTKAGLDAAQGFSENAKPTFRQFKEGEVPAEGEADPRVVRAKRLRDSVAKQVPTASDKQYFESLTNWGLVQSHHALGTVDNPDGFGKGTDMTKSGNDDAGVIEVTFDAGDPKKDTEVKVNDARISGFSKKTRDRLSKENPTLGTLSSLPIRARGRSFPLNGVIRVAQNEANQVFVLDSTRGGRQWLRERAAFERAQGFTDITADEHGGAVSLFQILSRARLDFKGGLQGPENPIPFL